MIYKIFTVHMKKNVDFEIDVAYKEGLPYLNPYWAMIRTHDIWMNGRITNTSK